MNERARLRHIPALDGLRGVAVVLVLFFHGGHLSGGFLGVDLFFVLSGFLITTLLLGEVSRSGGVALGAFWARRARRLLPALGLVLVGVALAAALWSAPDELDRIRDDALATIGYVANWHAIASGRTYFELFTSASPLEHTWSLAIEEQFYLLWPLVVLGLVHLGGRNRLGRSVLVTAIVGAVASTVLMVRLYDPVDTARAYYGTDTRAATLFAGIALAGLLAVRGPVTGRAARILLEIAGAVGVVALAVVFSATTGETRGLYHGGFLAIAVAMAVILAAAAHPSRGPIAWVLERWPLRALGWISYGLYLWHWPVDVYLDADRVGLTGWPLFAVDTAVALAFAIASYYFVEMPIRRGWGDARTWAWLTPVAAVTIAIGILVGTAGARSTDVAHLAADTEERGGVLVVGDSVAQSVAPGIAALGYEVTDEAFEGCRLLAGRIRGVPVLSQDCAWRPLWRDAVRRTDPEVVLFIQGALNLADIRPRGSDTWLVPGTPAWARYYRAGLERAVDTFGAGGARVVVPLIPCLRSTTPTAPAASLSAFDPARVRAGNAVIEALARDHPNVVAPDLYGYLCPDGRYQADLDGVSPVRVDGVHFGNAGADLVARFLEPQLSGARRSASTP